MKAIIILIAMFIVLYSMKVVSFDLPLLKEKYDQFTSWCMIIFIKIKKTLKIK